MRGQVKSAFSEDIDLDAALVVDDACRLLQHVGPPRPVLVGLSIGGLFAAQAWLQGAEGLALVGQGPARILTAESKTSDLVDSRDYIHPQSRLRDQDLVSDGGGSAGNGGGNGNGRHTMGHEHEPHQQQANDFARELCHMIEAGCRDNNLHRIYLVAPPKFLGLMRNGLNKQCAARIEDEINKNLVDHNLQDIRTHLPRIL